MTQQEKRIKIAEACGWTGFSPDSTTNFVRCIAKGPEGEWRLIPNYFIDLNEMHEAEKVLTENQRWNQIKLLTEWEPSPARFPLLSRCQADKLMRTTAAERAEAFGKTLNLW